MEGGLLPPRSPCLSSPAPGAGVHGDFWLQPRGVWTRGLCFFCLRDHHANGSCQCPRGSSPEGAGWGSELPEEALDVKNFMLLFFSAGEGVNGAHCSPTEEL